MKKLLVSLMLVWSWTTLAAPSASLEYFCELGDMESSGEVTIDEESIEGLPSCMSFKKFPAICFRFERRVSIASIFLSIGYAKNLHDRSGFKNLVLTNIPYGEGTHLSTKVKGNMGIQKDLTCTFKNVNWES